MKHLGRVLWAFLVVASLGAAARAQVTVEAKPDRTAATTRDVIGLSVEVSSSGSAGDLEVQIAPVDGLAIQRLPSVSTSFTIINGRQSSMRRYLFQITPQRAGTFILDGIAAVGGGQTYKAEPISLQITDAPQIPQNLAPGTSYVPVPPGSSLPAHFLRATLEPKKAYIDQPVKLTLELFTTASPQDSPRFDSQELASSDFSGKGFTCYEFDFGARRSYSYTQETLNGTTYMRVPIKVMYLFPVTAGTHHLPGLQMTLEMIDRTQRVRDFFGFSYGSKQIVLRSDPLELEVSGLPEEGKPKDFGGAVGQYRVQASVDKTDVKVGDPVTLTVTIAGQGRVDNVNTPDFGNLPDFRQFQVTSDKQPLKVDQNGVTGAITFTYVLIPKSQDATEIPPLSWSYFDPAAGKYVTLHTQSTRLVVHPGELSEIEPGLPAPYAGQRVSFGFENVDFRTIVPELDRLGGTPALLVETPTFWLMQLAPLAVMLGTWQWQRQRRRRMQNPAMYRSRRAGRAARKHLSEAEAARKRADAGGFYAALSSSLLGFVSDRFSFAARGLTQPQLRTRLEEQGASGETAGQLIETLSRWERLRYGGQGDDGSRRDEELAAARRLIEELEKRR